MSKITDAIAWFKKTFADQINHKIDGTPFTLNLVTAIAMQETYYVWGNFYKTLAVPELLKICVGDTIDAPNRSQFPKNKAELLAADKGEKMFAIARQALIDVGKHNAAYNEVAHMNPNKFCHGYGIVQYDLQFFKKTDPDFFLNKGWHDFDKCMDKGVMELKAALKRAYGTKKKTLTHDEMVYVAIAYNKGSVDLKKGFDQGYKDDSGKRYGQHVDEYLKLAEATAPAT
jgi:hypothetical protein